MRVTQPISAMVTAPLCSSPLCGYQSLIA